MKISRKIAAAAVSSLMVVTSTAGTMTYAAENNVLGALQGGVTIAANEVETKIYDGEAQITVGDATAKAGDTVSVPVYLSIPENDYITAIAFKAIYDKSALELTSITEPASPGLNGGKLDVSEENGIFCYTWSTKNITVNKSKPVCYYNFKVKSTASGEYTIKLVNHLSSDNSKPIEIVHTQEPHKKNTYLDPTVSYGSVTVLSAQNSSENTSKKYEGTAYIRLEQNVSALAGGTVDVPVYMELGSDVEGKFITGVGFKASYDTSSLTLTDIGVPGVCGLDGGESSVNAEAGVFCYTWSDKDITVDPSKPVCVFRFKVKNGASGKYDIGLVNHLAGNASSPVEVVHRQDKSQPSTYLTPVITKGSVVVSGQAVSTLPDDEEDDPISSITKSSGSTPITTTTTTKTTTPQKPTDPVDYDLLYWGDVNLDEYVDLADVTTLSKYLLSSVSYPLINSTAWENADCRYDGEINAPDLSKLIEFNLRKITIDDLGPADPALRRRSKRFQ